MSPRNAHANAAMRRATREKIVAASLELFSERGFASASMADIARRSGVSKGLAYHYFDTKEALLEAALAQHLDELLGVLKRARACDDPVDRLAALIDGLIDQAQERPAVFRLYLGLIVQSPAGPLERSIARLREPLDAYLEQIHDLFVAVGADEPETDAALFRSALLGVCIRIAMGNDRLATGALRRRLLKVFTGCARARVKAP